MMKWSQLSTEERDRLMHEKVMGGLPLQCPGQLIVNKKSGTSQGAVLPDWWWVTCSKCKFQRAYYKESKIPQQHESEQDIPEYSTDLNATWQIVERMTVPPQTFDVARQLRASRFALWREKQNLWAMSAQAVADSICLKSLQICGVEIEP